MKRSNVTFGIRNQDVKLLLAKNTKEKTKDSAGKVEAHIEFLIYQN
jgi:hypothetical protein